MLPSVLPKLVTDSAVRLFPGVWKLLFLRVSSRDGIPFPGRRSLPTSFVSFFVLLYFFLPVFEANDLLFWVSDVLCRHSEIVLWNLLSTEMLFWSICEGESRLAVLFLCHLRILSCIFLFVLWMKWYLIVVFGLGIPKKQCWVVFNVLLFDELYFIIVDWSSSSLAKFSAIWSIAKYLLWFIFACCYLPQYFTFQLFLFLYFVADIFSNYLTFFIF